MGSWEARQIRSFQCDFFGGGVTMNSTIFLQFLFAFFESKLYPKNILFFNCDSSINSFHENKNIFIYSADRNFMLNVIELQSSETVGSVIDWLSHEQNQVNLAINFDCKDSKHLVQKVLWFSQNCDPTCHLQFF